MENKMLYEQPKLIVYGTVENLTQQSGNGAADFVIGIDTSTGTITGTTTTPGNDPKTSGFSFI